MRTPPSPATTLAHVRCPDHGRQCGGSTCCCAEWHWRPLAYREHMRAFAVEDARNYRRRHGFADTRPAPVAHSHRDFYWVKTGKHAVLAGAHDDWVRTTWHVRFRLPRRAAGSVTWSYTRRRPER